MKPLSVQYRLEWSARLLLAALVALLVLAGVGCKAPEKQEPAKLSSGSWVAGAKPSDPRFAQKPDTTKPAAKPEQPAEENTSAATSKTEPSAEQKQIDQAVAALLGKWRQVKGGNASDFCEGGYTSSEIEFKADGQIRMHRVYGKQKPFTILRRTDYQLSKDGELLLGENAPFDEDALLKQEIELKSDGSEGPLKITPARQPLPLKLILKVSGNQMTLGTKIYTRVEGESGPENDGQ